MPSVSRSRSRRGGGHSLSKPMSSMHAYTVEIRELGREFKKECMEHGYTEQEAGELAQMAMKAAHEKKLETSLSRQHEGGSRRSTRRKRKGTRRH